jgi:hypothetical protein
VVYTVAVASVAQTGDNFARLGAPAGASVSADIAAAKVDTAAVKLQTDKLAFTVANQVDSNVIDWKGAAAPAMTGDAFARLGAPAGASVSADIATRSTYGGGDTAGTTTLLARVPGTVQPQTGDVFARLGAPAGASVSADVAAVAAYVDTEVAAILAAVDTEVAAIITTLGAAGAGLTALGDARLANLDATVSSRLASGSYTAPDNATITAIAGFVDTEVAAIKLKTDLIPAAPAAVGDVPTAIQNADALLDRAAGVETGLTPRQALRLFAAALLGKVSGAAANAPKFRDTGDTKDRITATTDADGNRTSVTLDPS